MRYVYPSKRPGQPDSTLTRARRLMHMEEARQREAERPFDPEAPREHYSQPHHFAVNPVRHLAGGSGYTLCGEVAHAETLADGPRDCTCFYCDQVWQRAHGGFAPNARGATQAPPDEHAAAELLLFIENTADLSLDGPGGQGHSVLLNALRKWRKGSYDPVPAQKLFGYLSESGARRYATEMRSSMPWNERFSVATRREVARQLEAAFRESAERGDYDGVDTSYRR